MPDRIELTWPEGDGHPLRILNPEPMRYGREKTVIENGHKVVQQSRVEFTVATARPATEAEVRKWRKQ